MKKNRFYSAGIAALLAAVLTAGFSGCSMNSGTETPAGGQGSVEEDSPEEALAKETQKYIAGFVFSFDEDDIGKDITRRVIELKGGQREDTSVQVSVVAVDGSGLFSLENGVLKLAALPQGIEQESGGDTDRETYKIFPGAGEVTLQFKKGDKIATLTVLCAIVEPGTEGDRKAIWEDWPIILCGYDKINESYRWDFDPWYPILDMRKVDALYMGILMEDPSTNSSVEGWLDCYYRDNKGNRLLQDINLSRIVTVLDNYFTWELLVKPADVILKNYGTHIMKRVTKHANGEFSHSDADLIPIWDIVPLIGYYGYGRDIAGHEKKDEIKKEYERQMALKNQP